MRAAFPMTSPSARGASWLWGVLFLFFFLNGCSGGDGTGNGHPIAAAPASFPNTASQLVLGQRSFTTSDVNLVDEKGLNFPRWVAVDSSGRLYVSDTDNNRILIYLNASGFANGDAAALVLGQVDFSSTRANQGGNGPTATTLWQPEGLAVDSAGNLYVADRNNNRVLRYNAPITTGQAANLVLGEVDFVNTVDRVNNRCNQTASGATPVALPTASTLCFPEGVALDSAGNLYVSDKGNHRVVRYTAPSTNGQGATLVLGQATLTPTSTTGTGCNRAGVPTVPPVPAAANFLCAPTGVALDSTGRLYVADEGNHRVLRFDPPFSDAGGNNDADLVLGQANFASNSCPAAAANTLCGPEGVVLDGSGNLYVADRGNNRVLRYTAPSVNGQAADAVLGPSVFGATRECNQGNVNAPNSTSLCDPVGVARDTNSSNLYVVDRGNNRVLRYTLPITTSQPATAVLGQGAGAAAFTRNGVNLVDGIGLNLPRWVAIDRSITPPRLYVADFSNHRVLRFNDISALTNGAAADLVLGQLTVNDNRCNRGSATPNNDTLCFPEGVAVDNTGNLYVADAGNNRVLRYTTPVTTGQVATLVFGQTGFTTGQCNQGLAAPTTSTLCTPVGVAVEINSSGGLVNLYVADTGNSRVVRYSAAPLDGVGDSFIGQASSTGGKCNRFDPLTLPPPPSPIPPFNLPAPAANTLCGPEGVTVDSSGNLYVADTVNNRVLRYTAPIATNQSASIVLGQTGFTTGLCNQGGANPADTTLCVPVGVALDSSNNLYVSDQGNNRVLRYNNATPPTPPTFTTGQAANLIIGQTQVEVPGVGLSTTIGCNQGDPTPSASTLCNPMGLATEGLTLFVADISNNRVLKFVP